MVTLAYDAYFQWANNLVLIQLTNKNRYQRHIGKYNLTDDKPN